MSFGGATIAQQQGKGWFGRLCRNLGLTVHHVMHPEHRRKRVELRRDVEESKQSGNVTLRRTTIEEIEYEQDGGAAKDDSRDQTNRSSDRDDHDRA